MSKSSAETVNVGTRKFLFLNGLFVSVSNFKWLILGQLTGWPSKEEATAYAKQVNHWAKINSVEPRKFTIKERFVVMFGIMPVGSMYDFGQGPVSGKGKRKLMLPFPEELRGCYNGLESKEEADRLAKKFRLYLEDICTVPKEHRTGSMKFI